MTVRGLRRTRLKGIFLYHILRGRKPFKMKQKSWNLKVGIDIPRKNSLEMLDGWKHAQGKEFQRDAVFG